jgi:4'-phosphopantetheinyl transferase
MACPDCGAAPLRAQNENQRFHLLTGMQGGGDQWPGIRGQGVRGQNAEVNCFYFCILTFDLAMADELANDAGLDFDSWDLRPDRLELEADEVHVWRGSLDCGERALDQFDETLTPDEKARAQRFVFQPDRNSYIAARGILRELLGRYLNRAPSEIEFDYGAQGKPALRSESSEKPVQFNVSHSHGMALFAFSVGRQVGVDVELVRPDFAGEKIAERFFSAQEVMELRRLPATAQDEGFFLCWTRKEAYIKARGEGLQIPLKSFHVSLTPGEPARLQADDSSRWSLRSLRLEGRYVGAVVGEGQDWKLRGWEAKAGNHR